MSDNPVQVTNGWIAKKIGYSESGVSLLRRGLRSPTLQTMKSVSEAVGWSQASQIEALCALDWDLQFNSRMAEAFEEEIKNNTTEEK